MPKVIYIAFDGARSEVVASNGTSVMQAAVDNGVRGIVGDCGGSCSCATCHAYVDEAWMAKIPEMSEDEKFMLEGALDVKPNSRLTCQIKLSDALDGLTLSMPKSQL